jgi:cystathionine beta-synthase/cysteine synthase A
MIGSDLIESIGDTPLLRLNRFVPRVGVRLLAKWEALNPGGSVKDRPARHIVGVAEERGLLQPGGTIVEATSGNFGVALAMVGAARGYRVVIVIDPKLPQPYRRTMLAYGAELVEVTGKDESGGYFRTRLDTANRLAGEIPGAFRPDQHFSLANAAAHYMYTAPEIFRQLDGRVDCLVTAISTAGQIRGLAEYFRQHSPSTVIVGVDAVGSGVFGGPLGAYLQTGIGLGWSPSNLEVDQIDHMFRVSDADAFAACRALARLEGVLAGASSGAVAFVGLHLALRATPDERIVCVFSDGGSRYLDTIYDDAWLAGHGVTLDASISALADRAAMLTALPAEEVRRRIAEAGTFEPIDPPATTAGLNEAAALAMRLSDQPMLLGR